MLDDLVQDYWLGSGNCPVEVKSVTPLPRPRRSRGELVRGALLKLAAGRARIRSHEENVWAPITFSGSRHEVVLEFVGVDTVVTRVETVRFCSI
jgi:hypothetical protein